LLMLIGQAMLFSSLATLWYALTAWPFFHAFVMLYEEPALRHKFGDSYEKYSKSTPRWIPRW